MLHRVVLGAMERFIGVLIEHYAGAFPVWLAPIQAVLMTVTDRQVPYAEGVYKQLIQRGVRAEKDFRNEKLGFKIREAHGAEIEIARRNAVAAPVTRQEDESLAVELAEEKFVGRNPEGGRDFFHRVLERPGMS